MLNPNKTKEDKQRLKDKKQKLGKIHQQLKLLITQVKTRVNCDTQKNGRNTYPLRKSLMYFNITSSAMTRRN
jgi:Asp/Glu/hydantoin racemase